jgi:hypothetical protein
MKALSSSCIDLSGQRFGKLLVLGPGPVKRFPCKQSHRMWRVRCDCGAVSMTLGFQLRQGVSSQCVACGRAASAKWNRAHSTRLPSGRTVAEVALASGVALNTVFQRYKRGWAEDDLGLPVVGNLGRKQRVLDAGEGA